jgi:hypothetical protein
MGIYTKVPVIFIFTKFDILVNNMCLGQRGVTGQGTDLAKQQAQARVTLIEQDVESAVGGPVTSVIVQGMSIIVSQTADSTRWQICILRMHNVMN